MKRPTALITYNRPSHTARILAKLREHRIEPLFVFSDGPKSQADAEKVRAVRELIAGISWTQPTVVTRGKNLGLKNSVISAVDRVLKQYETIIVLEDDCIPGPWFFEFVTQCLERYKDNRQVLTIGGWTVPLSHAAKDYAYDAYFQPRVETWGWATWRRAWPYYERNVKAAYARAKRAGIDLNQGGTDVPGMIERFIGGKLDAWSPGWLLGVYLNRGYCVYPVKSHIQNIGFDGSGVHCGTTSHFNSPICQSKPSRFPDRVILHAPIVKRVKEFYS